MKPCSALRRALGSGQTPPPANTGTRWRVLITGASDPSWYSCQELEFRAVHGGPDITSSTLASARAFANAFYDVAAPECAFNGSLTDVVYGAWAVSKTASPPTNIGWNFIEETAVTELAWLPQARADLINRSPSSFTVQRFVGDSGPWVDVATFTGITGWTLGVWKVFSW